MIQHPIPQDITNYKFHLIGSMTLKQFAELAGGAIIAFIVYKSNLIGIVRWPIFIFIVLLSIMIAFVPYEERPLDHWIITFFKNLWKPTKFFWKKTPKVPDLFNYKAHDPNQAVASPDVNYSPARKSRIQEYLSSIPQNDEQLDDWDIFRQDQAQQLIKEFDQVRVKAENISVQKEELSKPQLKTRVRKLKSLEKIETTGDVEIVKAAEPAEAKPLEVKTAVEIVESTTPANPAVAINEPMIAPQSQALAGVVFNANQQVVPQALVEIVDQNQQTLRMVKTNALGEFQINTPLPNGDYLLKTEAGDLNFSPQALQINDNNLPAIKIIAEQGDAKQSSEQSNATLSQV